MTAPRDYWYYQVWCYFADGRIACDEFGEPVSCCYHRHRTKEAGLKCLQQMKRDWGCTCHRYKLRRVHQLVRKGKRFCKMGSRSKGGYEDEYNRSCGRQYGVEASNIRPPRLLVLPFKKSRKSRHSRRGKRRGY